MRFVDSDEKEFLHIVCIEKEKKREKYEKEREMENRGFLCEIPKGEMAHSGTLIQDGPETRR